MFARDAASPRTREAVCRPWRSRWSLFRGRMTKETSSTP